MLLLFQSIPFSPRAKHCPKPIPSKYANMFKKPPDDADTTQLLPAAPPITVKMTDELVNWRDEDDNSLLHLAAWHGRTLLARQFFDSMKGRKLVTAVNKKGATPLALAIIGGQVPTYLPTYSPYWVHVWGIN